MKEQMVLFWKKYRTVILTAACGFLLTRIFFFAGMIASPSMEPTLITGSTVLYEKIPLRKIRRGDIVAFDRDGELICKRVIGIGGDEIVIKDGVVWINEEVYEEPYLSDETRTNAGKETRYMVPEGSLFLLGDNRGNSYDARYWEEPMVTETSVKGIYLCTLP